MKEIKAYKCSVCGKTSETKGVITKCENKHKEEKLEAEKRHLERQKNIDDLNYPRLNARNPLHYLKLLAEWTEKQGEPIDFKFLHLNYTDKASNSHCCPLAKDKPSNWCGRDPDKPTGYPGFVGRIQFTKRPPKGRYCSEVIDPHRHKGFNFSSGGGAYKAIYGITLFIDDFPLWKEKAKELSKLRKEYSTIRDQNQKNNYALLGKINNAISNDNLIHELQAKITAREKELANQITKSNPDLKQIEYDTARLLELEKEFGVKA